MLQLQHCCCCFLDDEGEDLEKDGEDILGTDNKDDDIQEVVGKSSIHAGTVVSVPHPQSVVSAHPAPPPQSTGEWVLHCIKAIFRDVKKMTWHQPLVVVLPSGVGLESSRMSSWRSCWTTRCQLLQMFGLFDSPAWSFSAFSSSLFFNRLLPLGKTFRQWKRIKLKTSGMTCLP